MKFSMNTKSLLAQLLAVGGSIENKSTMEVMTHVLIQAKNNTLTLTGVNPKIQLVVSRPVEIDQEGETTAPYKKLVDICKALPPVTGVDLHAKDSQLIVKSGRSRFTMTTIPARDFPNIEDPNTPASVTIVQGKLHNALKKVVHAMAIIDVRHFMKGTLFHIFGDRLNLCATDGHRLALCGAQLSSSSEEMMGIMPSASANILLGLLTPGEKEILVKLGPAHAQIHLPFGDDGSLMLTTMLIDGRFPDYNRVIPDSIANPVHLNCIEMTAALTRTALLSNEKAQNVRLQLTPDLIRLQASNAKQDEAEDSLTVEYSGPSYETGFNYAYLSDALKNVEAPSAVVGFGGPHSAAKITDPSDPTAVFVVMPVKF